MTRFVVIRRYLGVEVWYVEAPDAPSALARVWPEDPASDPRFAESGSETPSLEAHVDVQPVRAHAVRRFPRGVDICFGYEERRASGPDGEG